jgi:methylglyoxal synthase
MKYMNPIINKPSKKRIALIARNNKKTELAEWTYSNRDALLRHEFITTETAGYILEGTTGAPVTRLTHGRGGDYRQLCTMIAREKIDVLLLFLDAVEFEKEKDYINDLLVSAIKAGCLVALNQETADKVLNLDSGNAITGCQVIMTEFYAKKAV